MKFAYRSLAIPPCSSRKMTHCDAIELQFGDDKVIWCRIRLTLEYSGCHIYSVDDPIRYSILLQIREKFLFSHFAP